ncbi:MAG TPA: elongation factor G [Treponemataceae bacterium]|nr:elongation factor G [Treponemataceae bacterium]
MIDMKRMRNIGIMAHVDAGKTTTTERILYYTGKIHSIGEIDDGAATMDWMSQEQDRGITIQSAATTSYWKNHQINIIDTPGHVDFTAEVKRSLRVLDGAIAVICAVGGVQPQTETVWRQADEFYVPRMCFVNKMDRIGADFFAAMQDVKEKFNTNTIALAIPIGSENKFEGIIDLLHMKELRFDPNDEGETIVESEITSNRIDTALEWREKILDEVSSTNDDIAELYLEGKEIPLDMIKAEIRRATIARQIVPFFCGSARKNTGIQLLVDAVVDYLPAPDEVPPAVGQHIKKDETIDVVCDSSGTPCALVFKIQHDKEAGSLCYIRMYAGTFKTGQQVYNIAKKKRERINRILRMHSNKSEKMDSVKAGDIAVIIGFKNAQTGDTIGSEGVPVLLENVSFPEPVISVSIEPDTVSDAKKLRQTLDILSKEDPTFTHKDDTETGQLIISGMGELHIDVLVTRMLQDFKLGARVGNPRVTYRESIAKTAEHTETYSKILGGDENTAGIRLKIQPAKNLTLEDLVGFETFGSNYYRCNMKERNKKSDVHIPKEIFESVKNGITNSYNSGINYGYPCTNLAVTVTEVQYDELTTTPFATEACAVAAFDAVCNAASPVLLEPVMNVEITSPAEFVGEAMSQITQRGGIISSLESKTSVELVQAQAPMAKMFGFSTSLRSVTQGRASFSMEFSHFQVKPGGL